MQFAMDPSQGGLIFTLVGILVGAILGFFLKIPLIGLLLGFFGMPGWLATAIVYFIRKNGVQDQKN